MTSPTPEEIEGAMASITDDGPISQATIDLAEVTRRNVHFRRWITRVLSVFPHIQAEAPPDSPPDAALEAALSGALMYGLSVGLRIGEARAKQAESDAASIASLEYAYWRDAPVLDLDDPETRQLDLETRQLDLETRQLASATHIGAMGAAANICAALVQGKTPKQFEADLAARDKRE